MQHALQGAMTALITPFKNGKLDEVHYAKLIKIQTKKWQQKQKIQIIGSRALRSLSS
jgi:dihydrodipicolinate synthase/N-acetylneuraminate lyase